MKKQTLAFILSVVATQSAFATSLSVALAKFHAQPEVQSWKPEFAQSCHEVVTAGVNDQRIYRIAIECNDSCTHDGIAVDFDGNGNAGEVRSLTGNTCSS